MKKLPVSSLAVTFVAFSAAFAVTSVYGGGLARDDVAGISTTGVTGTAATRTNEAAVPDGAPQDAMDPSTAAPVTAKAESHTTAGGGSSSGADLASEDGVSGEDAGAVDQHLINGEEPVEDALDEVEDEYDESSAAEDETDD